MSKNYILILISTILLSCNRFDHKESIQPQECGCCSLADSIEGTYTGNLLKFKLSGFDGQANVDTLLDTTITVGVARTFEGLNYLEDSLFCQFDVSHFYETPIRFTASSIKKGAFYHDDIYFQEFNQNNKFTHKRNGVLDYGKWGQYTYPLVEFIGLKDE